MNELIRNKEVQKFVIYWLIYWMSVMGGFILILKPMGINHQQNIHISIPFYLLCALGAVLLWFKNSWREFVYHPRTQLFLYILTSFLFVYLTIIISSYVPLSKGHEEYLLYKEFFYPLMSFNSSLSKLSDIIFQQVLIVILVLFLKSKLQDNKKAISIFTFVFFILHVPLFNIFGFSGIVFILPSLFAGAIFSYCILNLKWGIYYSMCVHQAYYIVLAILLRLTPLEYLP